MLKLTYAYDLLMIFFDLLLLEVTLLTVIYGLLLLKFISITYFYPWFHVDPSSDLYTNEFLSNYNMY